MSEMITAYRSRPNRNGEMKGTCVRLQKECWVFGTAQEVNGKKEERTSFPFSHWGTCRQPKRNTTL